MQAFKYVHDRSFGPYTILSTDLKDARVSLYELVALARIAREIEKYTRKAYSGSVRASDDK